MCSIKGKHIRIKWAIVWLLFTCKIYFVHVMSEQSASMREKRASDLALSDVERGHKDAAFSAAIIQAQPPTPSTERANSPTTWCYCHALAHWILSSTREHGAPLDTRNSYGTPSIQQQKIKLLKMIPRISTTTTRSLQAKYNTMPALF